MIEKFKLLVKNVGVLEAIKMMGGFDTFREIAENNPQFKPYLDKLKGSCSVSLVNTPDAYFDFYIMDYDIMDGEFVELIVDMIVNFNNLSGEEIYQLKQWFGAVADDHGFEIYDIDLKIPTHQNLYIKSFNGRPYTFEGYEDFISDDEAIELLDKTGLWEGMIRESINESVVDDLKVAKQRFFKIWDGRGYASVDEMMMKLFHISLEHNYTVQDWVQEWNEINKVNPLKYLEEDGYKFNQPSSPHLYFAEVDGKKIEFREPDISGDVLINRIDVNTNDKSINVWMEIIFETITEPRFNGRTFEEMYPDNEMEDEDYYFSVVDGYRDEFMWLTVKYFQEKYVNKMGYELEVDFG
jgi:hypothetical protein